MNLIISQKNGFKKQFKVEKSIIRIGSSASNDISLSSDAVLAYHLQVLYSADFPDRCQVVNLSADPVAGISKGSPFSLPAFSVIEIAAGDEINLGEARIFFELPIASGTLISSNKITALARFPESVMRPNTPLVGRIMLKNEGDQPSCQFQVEILGLPADCYQIDPIPLMYPGAQEDVNARFFHRKTYPNAGFHPINILITAPASYPGEQVNIQQGIYIAPVLEQSFQILDDMPAPQPLPLETPVQAEPIEPVMLPEPVDPVLVEPPAPEVIQAEVVPASAEPVAIADNLEPAPAPRLPIKPKVVKAPSQSYWDE